MSWFPVYGQRGGHTTQISDGRSETELCAVVNETRGALPNHCQELRRQLKSSLIPKASSCNLYPKSTAHALMHIATNWWRYIIHSMRPSNNLGSLSKNKVSCWEAYLFVRILVCLGSWSHSLRNSNNNLGSRTILYPPPNEAGTLSRPPENTTTVARGCPL